MASNSNNEIPEKLLKEIDNSLNHDQNLYIKFLTYIACKDKEGSNQLIKILNHILDTNPNIFKQTVKSMAIDAVKALDNHEYIKILQDLWNNYIVPADIKIETASLDFERLANLNKHNGAVIQYNLLRSLSKIPPESIGGVINFIKTVSSSSSKLTNICNSSVSLLKNAKQLQATQVVLLVAYLTWEAYESIKQWWNGEISGKRCAKQIVDSVTSVLAGTGVGIIGGMIGGGLLGPAGMAVGSIVGGIFFKYILVEII